MFICSLPDRPANDPPVVLQVVVFIVVAGYGAGLLHAGAALESVLATLTGLGLVGALVAGQVSRPVLAARGKAGAR